MNGGMETLDRIQHVLHISRAYSAEPTLSITMGDHAQIRETSLPEALNSEHEPDLLWVTDPTVDELRTLRIHFPTASVLVTRSRYSRQGATTMSLIDSGADLVIEDESVICAAAGLGALARRPRA